MCALFVVLRDRCPGFVRIKLADPFKPIKGALPKILLDLSPFFLMTELPKIRRNLHEALYPHPLHVAPSEGYKTNYEHFWTMSIFRAQS
jgi:hypothetical protein